MDTQIPAEPVNDRDCLINSLHVRKLCGSVSEMTLHRWRNDPDLNFPQATKINSRLYWKRGAIDDWLAERAAASEAA